MGTETIEAVQLSDGLYVFVTKNVNVITYVETHAGKPLWKLGTVYMLTGEQQEEIERKTASTFASWDGSDEDESL